MSKKNDKRAIQKRHDIVKKQMVEQQRKRQERSHLRALCRNMKSHLENIAIGEPRPGGGGETIQEIEMANPKTTKRGINFLRELGSAEPITARQKKVLKQALKRKRKVGL